MSKPHRTELERFRYWQGQLLRSRDFRDQAETEAQLLHWHNRALHNVYGVAFGMTTSLVAKAGEELPAVRVTCGLAYDCYGQELLLPETLEIRVPRIPTEDKKKRAKDAQRPVTATLVASYRDAATYQRKDESSAVCLSGQCKPLYEEPVFRWEFSNDCYEAVEGVPIAKIRYVTNKFNKRVTIRIDPDFVQPMARPMARPRMASGHTIAGNTTWRLWEVDVLHPGFSGRGGGIEKVPVGMQTWIDTTSAGFTELPCYFAWLQGPQSEEGSFSMAPLTSITDVSLTGFTFRLLMPPLYRRAYNIAIASAAIEDVTESQLHEVVLKVDDVSRFRVDDLVTVDGKDQALIQAIQRVKNNMTLSKPLVALKRNARLRTASIKPEQQSIRLESVEGLQPGSEVIISSGGSSGLVVSDEVRANAIIENINHDTSTITLAPNPARSVDIRLEAQLSPAVWQIFNESFTTRFLPFAHRKGLYVCWLGCQQPDALPLDCTVRPGVQTLCP